MSELEFLLLGTPHPVAERKPSAQAVNAVGKNSPKYGMVKKGLKEGYGKGQLFTVTEAANNLGVAKSTVNRALLRLEKLKEAEVVVKAHSGQMSTPATWRLIKG